ncbi:MAG: hypothetical protein CYG59_18115 [Chloroflexi bacterium]|nr:MAG: hypothetical protein CYG59_18115 [Chloroflexota bacterium]
MHRSKHAHSGRQRVVALLNRLNVVRGLPHVISVDNGPECISKGLDDWAHPHAVQLEFSRPGTPTDHPYIEAFNGRVRVECLSQHWFASVDDARRTIERWRREGQPRTAPWSAWASNSSCVCRQLDARPGRPMREGVTQHVEGTRSRRN